MNRSVRSPQIFVISGKLLFVLVLLYFAIQLVFSSDPWIPFDFANLLIHESGHFIFSIFGEFVSILGGSLFQILVPTGIAIYFFYHRQIFSSAFALYWMGDNCVNVARYIKDAQSMQLPLLGGGIHDWNWLLSQTGLLSLNQEIGIFVQSVGIIFLIIGLTGMVGTCVYHIEQYISLKEMPIR